MPLALRSFAALAIIFAVAACSLIPSSWRIGGSPLDKNEKAQAKQQQAQQAAVTGAQAAVHQAGIALAAAPVDNRAVAVGRDFVAEAQLLLDQANGAPTYNDAAKWRELVNGLLSDNASVRKAAEKQRATDAALTGDLAQRLAAATAAAERANDRALTYARESEDLADFARKLKLGFFCLIGLMVLGTVLSLAARFYPALGLASNVVNAAVAPGITFLAHRAQTGLVRVGQGLAKLRTIAGDAAEDLIERSFDGVTDADHQSLIAAGAKAAQPQSSSAK